MTIVPHRQIHGTSTAASVTVGAPRTIRAQGRITLSFDVTGLSADRLDYEVEEEYSAFLSARSDAALVALLVPAMAAGKPLLLQGAVSARLLANARLHFMPLLCSIMPGLSPVPIEARAIDEAEDSAGPAAVLTGLSNGIDSLSVVADYLGGGSVPGEAAITHFLFNDVGNHGRFHDVRCRQLFEHRTAHIRRAAARFGLPLICVRSNLDEFFHTPFPQTHTLRNASVALLLQRGVRHFLYAAGVTYSAMHGAPSKDTAYSDALLLPLLCTPTLTCQSVGAGRSRIEKTALIASRDWAREILHVCVREEENCGECWKCARTLLTLDLLEHSADFSARFDLGRFFRIRGAYVAHILGSRHYDRLSDELVQLMIAKGGRPSLRQRFGAGVTRALLGAGRIVPLRLQQMLARRLGVRDAVTLSEGLNPNRLWTIKLLLAKRFLRAGVS